MWLCQRLGPELQTAKRPRSWWKSVGSADGILRGFAGYLTVHHPEIVALADVERAHVEAYKAYLLTRPGRNGHLSPQTIRIKLGTLRTFFERVSERGCPDAPSRIWVCGVDEGDVFPTEEGNPLTV